MRETLINSMIKKFLRRDREGGNIQKVVVPGHLNFLQKD